MNLAVQQTHHIDPIEELRSLFAKVGGENASLVDDNLENIRKTSQQYDFNVRVFSAMRTDTFNTTDHLLSLAQYLGDNHLDLALKEIEQIETFHFDLLSKNLTDFESYIDLQKMIKNEFSQLRELVNTGTDYSQLSGENDFSIGGISILGFGELLSAKIYYYVLQEQGGSSHYLDTSDLGGDIANVGVLVERFRSRLLDVLNSGEKNVMVPGFIAGLEGGILNFFERGYSDATAGVLSQVALDIDSSTENRFGFETIVLNIQKSVDGFLTTDPRLLEGGLERTKLVKELSVDLALRIISDHGAKAKLLNEEALNDELVKALRENPKLKVLLNNPFGDREGTFISGSVETDVPKVQFILTKEQIEQRYKNVVGVGCHHSLYLMGEQLLASEGLDDYRSGILHNLIDVLQSHKIPYSETFMVNGLKETIGISFHSKEDSLKALNILHRHYFENKTMSLNILPKKVQFFVTRFLHFFNKLLGTF